MNMLQLTQTPVAKKALLEHTIILNLVADRFPKGLETR